MSKGQKVPVTVRALMQRINRKLGPDAVLKTSRGASETEQLGDRYVLHRHNNRVDKHHVDIEALGRSLGVLKPWEELVVEDER